MRDNHFAHGRRTYGNLMIGSALQFADLQQLTGYTRLSDVERCLRAQGVPFKRGRDGVWTTMEALNAALGVSWSGNEPDYSPEQFFNSV